MKLKTETGAVFFLFYSLYKGFQSNMHSVIVQFLIIVINCYVSTIHTVMRMLFALVEGRKVLTAHTYISLLIGS